MYYENFSRKKKKQKQRTQAHVRVERKNNVKFIKSQTNQQTAGQTDTDHLTKILCNIKITF